MPEAKAQMAIKEAQEFAAKLWQKHPNDGNLVVKKCYSCISAWRAAGSEEGNKPPNYPPDFSGACPCCGDALDSRPVIG